MKTLRPYQISAIKSVEDALAKGITKSLVVMATGTGKSLVNIKIIENKGKTIWVTHNTELILQSTKAIILEKNEVDGQKICDFISSFKNTKDPVGDAIEYAHELGMMAEPHIQWLRENIGIIKADKFYFNAPIVIASAQTLWRRLDKINPQEFDVMVIDEAHLFGSVSFYKSVSYFTPKLLLGSTATPLRQDGMMMGDIFDSIVYQYNIADGIKDGFLAQIEAIRVKTTLSLDGCRTTAGELNQKDLKETVDIPERNKLIVQKYREYAIGRQTIVFCVDVEHAQNVNQAFLDEGFKSDFVVSDTDLTPDRIQVVDDFKSGKLDILCNVSILTTGFDHPETSCVIMACPTKSETRYLQSIGRATRLKKNYKECIILDIVDSTTRHRLVNTYTLEKDKPLEERVFMTDDKRQKLIDSRNENNKKREFESKTKKDERIQLIPLPKVKQSNSIRMQEAATEAQLAWIARLGYDILNTHYTKLMCSEIISNQSATSKQISFLKWRGWDTRLGVTLQEAKKAFELMDAKEAKAKKKEIFKSLPIRGL